MKQKILIIGCFCLFTRIAALAENHTRFLDYTLDMKPLQLVEELERRGMERDGDRSLLWRLSGMDISVRLNCKNDTTGINSLTLATLGGDMRNSRADYSLLLKWMRKNYGEPTWEGFVRSHPFARWYVDFDRDIVLIATGGYAIEVWFYENHHKRNVDYYSILKYCERHPVESAPYMTASESVTWKSIPVPTAKKKPSRHHVRKKASKVHRKTKARKRRRR